MHIGDNIFMFQDNNEGIYLSKLYKNCFGKVTEKNKKKMIKVLKICKMWGKTRGFLENNSTREH